MTTFKIVETTGEMMDCECCGSYCSEGLYVYVDETLVWEKYTDGHYSGNQTDEPLVDCVLAQWHATSLYTVEINSTEESRVEWNRKYPGNHVASTPETWNEQKKGLLTMQEDSYAQIKVSCENLPYDEHLQLKMIALWIENDTGYKTDIIEETEIEISQDYDDE